MEEINQKIEGNNNIINIGGNVIIKQGKQRVVQKYPEGCIGHDTIKANYIGHLTQRYHEYKEREVGKGNVNYAMFPAHLKKAFKIPATRTIYNLPIERFEELYLYIQDRIDHTMFAKKLGKGHKNYSSYDEYAKDQMGK